MLDGGYMYEHVLRTVLFSKLPRLRMEAGTYCSLTKTLSIEINGLTLDDSITVQYIDLPLQMTV